MSTKTTARKRSAAPVRRGRPAGSVALTEEIERTIVAYVEAGAFDYVAAEAAGIDDRTFRDWMARGLGRHPTRTRTRQLARFAKAVLEAKARARVAREITVADRDPRFWLAHAARSKPGREGWTDPVEDPAQAAGPPAYAPTEQETAATVRALIESGALRVDACADPECTCRYHRAQEERQ
jgi:hypothetical protein